MQFSDLINCDTSKSNNHANSDSYTFNSDDSLSDDETFPQPQEKIPFCQKLYYLPVHKITKTLTHRSLTAHLSKRLSKLIHLILLQIEQLTFLTSY